MRKRGDFECSSGFDDRFQRSRFGPAEASTVGARARGWNGDLAIGQLGDVTNKQEIRYRAVERLARAALR